MRLECVTQGDVYVRQPDKPIATSANGAGMAQASTDESKAGDAVKQESEEQEISEDEAAAQLGDFA